MSTWPVRNEQERQELINAIRERPFPFTAELVKGVKRSNQQNRLQRKWCKEAEQQGDMTAEEYRGLMKLTYGVPLMSAQSELFATTWERISFWLSYEEKMALMMEPIDMPVTRNMSSATKKRYLDAVYHHFTGLGMKLTEPNLQGLDEEDFDEDSYS